LPIKLVSWAQLVPAKRRLMKNNFFNIGLFLH
jgi:hypothetical protein